MNCIVIGTDHRMQGSEPGFDGLVRGLLRQQFFEPVKAIAEEYADGLGQSVGQRVAQEMGLRWFNLDMTTDEKRTAGILEEQCDRREKSQEAGTIRVPSDDVREEAMANKVATCEPGTVIVICGYLHFESLVRRLRQKGFPVDKRVYLETIPEIKTSH